MADFEREGLLSWVGLWQRVEVAAECRWVGLVGRGGVGISDRKADIVSRLGGENTREVSRLKKVVRWP